LEKIMNQHPTTPLAFHESGRSHLLFSVTPDIPAADALHSASELLSAVAHALDAAATGITQIDAHHAFVLHHALRAAKATVDSLIPT
jgi:hypothetical protein